MVRRDVRCSGRSFDELATLACGVACSCRACVRERQRASPLMDSHDAYTLTTAMRVIERSHSPPASAPPVPAQQRVPSPHRPAETKEQVCTERASPATGFAAATTIAANTASAILRRRAGIRTDIDTASKGEPELSPPARKENFNLDLDLRPSAQLASPVFEESPLAKPAMEAYSAAVLQSVVTNQPLHKHSPTCGRRAPSLQICKSEFTTSTDNV